MTNKKIKAFYLIASLFLVFSIPLISKAVLGETPVQTQGWVSTLGQGGSDASGNAVNSVGTGFQVDLTTDYKNTATGAITPGIPVPIIQADISNYGRTVLTNTAAASDMAYQSGGNTMVPQKRLTLTDTDPYNGTNQIWSQFDGILTSMTWAGNDGTVKTYKVALGSDGKQDIIGPPGSGKWTYNFEKPTTTGEDAWGGGSGSVPATNFAGTLTVAPKTAGVPFGVASFADYTVTFKSFSDYSGPVVISLEGACPVTFCVFTTSTNGNISGFGITFSATLRLSSAANFAQGQYEFKVNASPTGGAGDPDKVIQNGFYSVYKNTPANAFNKASYVSYANVPPNGGTMNPGETRQVTVTMKNVGTTDWTLNTGGALCSSAPPNNGYYLHPQNNLLTWGVDKVALNSDSTNGMVTSLPAGRYVRISGLGNSWSSGTGYLGVREVQAFDSNGIIHYTHSEACIAPGNCSTPAITQSSLFLWGGTALLGAADSNITSGFIPANGLSNQWIQIDYGGLKNFTEIKVLPHVLGAWDDDPIQVQIGDATGNFGPPISTFISGSDSTWFSTKKAVGDGLPYYKYLRFLVLGAGNLSGWTTPTISEIEIFDSNGTAVPIQSVNDYGVGIPSNPATMAVDGDVGTAWTGPTNGATNGAVFPTSVLNGYAFDVALAVPTSLSRVKITGAWTQNLVQAVEVWGSNDSNVWNAGWCINCTLENNRWNKIAFRQGGGDYEFRFNDPTNKRNIKFTFNITAPVEAGTYPFQWRMHQECVEDFDDSSTLVNITVPAGVGPEIKSFTVHTPDTVADTAGSSGGNGFLKNQRYWLKWETLNTTSCTASGSWSGAKAFGGGTENRTADSATTGLKTYELSCSNGGLTVKKTVNVQVNDDSVFPCKPQIIGTNQMKGCVYKWDNILGGGDMPASPNVPKSGSGWVLVGDAPLGNVMTDPISDSPINSVTYLDFNWGSGGPLAGLNDYFKIVWKGEFNFNSSGSSSYIFNSGSDDGRTLSASSLAFPIVDKWYDQSLAKVDAPSAFLSGKNTLTFNMYDRTADSAAFLSSKTSANSSCGVNMIPLPSGGACPAASITSTGYTLSWSPPGWTGPPGYTLGQRIRIAPNTPAGIEAANTGCPGWPIPCAVVDNNVLYTGNSYVVTGLSPDTEYYNRIPAVCTNNGYATFDYRDLQPWVCKTGPATGPTVTLTANSTNIPYNTSTTLNWSYTNATSCTITPPATIGGYPNGSGSVSTGNLATSRTYTISCDPGGVNKSITVNVQAQPKDLTVIKSGQGKVTSTSNPTQANQINCSSGCPNQTVSFAPNTTVTLTATPAPGRIFTGWSGAGCSGKGGCIVLMDGGKTVIANFAVDPNFKEF